jgi:hypothetical protein
MDKFDPKLFLRTTTLEGAFISLDVMVIWKIVDSQVVATEALEILNDKNVYGKIDQQKAI